MSQTKYDDANHSWSDTTAAIFARIEVSAENGEPMVLSAAEVDRLAGALWHLGVFQ